MGFTSVGGRGRYSYDKSCSGCLHAGHYKLKLTFVLEALCSTTIKKDIQLGKREAKVSFKDYMTIYD